MSGGGSCDFSGEIVVKKFFNRFKEGRGKGD